MPLTVTQSASDVSGGTTPAILLRLIEANTPLKLIAQSLGMHETSTGLKVRTLVAKLGLTYNPQAAGHGNHVSVTTLATYQLRVNFYNWVTAYREHWPVEPSIPQMSRVLGISTRSVKRICNRPYDHDWTITQISRLAIAVGMTVESLLLDCAGKVRIRLPSLIDLTPIHPEQMD